MDRMEPALSAKASEKDPVFLAFNNEIREFKVFVKRVASAPSLDQNSYAKGSKTLFEMWNKYQTRLPAGYFEEQMLQTADFLSDMKLYRLAIQQGYGRFLQQRSPVGLEQIRDVQHFNSTFCPQGFEKDNTGLTFRALQGQCQCRFLLERGRGDQCRVQKLLQLLSFLRLMMQALLPHESLCWILYNGSLHIYNICTFLMSLGHSAQALEFLLWACVCLETSVPLLSVRFLTWRATLYCAVCQCYYRCQAATQAEALGKISDLGRLQERSSAALSTHTQGAFKEATIKLAVMVFKRLVFEPRRRPKGLFRPSRQRSTLKEAKMTPWPRTPTERALMELFEGGAAQFLALTEALWDGARRPLQTGGAGEPEMQEVALELLGIVPHSSSLLELATAGDQGLCVDEHMIACFSVARDNGVSVGAAVRFVKLLFGYEQWDLFSHLSSSLLTLLQDREETSFQQVALDLTLMRAMEPLLNSQKARPPQESSVDGAAERDRLQGMMSEEVLLLVETLHTCVCGSAQEVQPDRALVMDIVQYLWLRCKAVFQTGHWDPLRCQGRLENDGKWVQVLSALSEVALVCELGLSDPVAVAEMTLRLAAILESTADSTLKSGRKTGGAVVCGDDVLRSSASSGDTSLISASSFLQCDAPDIAKSSRAEQLQAVWNMLERAVESVSCGRARLLLCDSTAASDPVCQQPSEGEESEGGASGRRGPQDSASSLIKDLHLELLAVQHRVTVKLLNTCPGKSSNIPQCSLAQEATSLVEKAKMEESRLEAEQKRLSNGRAPGEGRSRVPPAPVLLSRTHRSMTFAPAPYALHKQVCWYSLYGREATGLDQKARLGHCHLLGTGEEVRPQRSLCRALCAEGRGLGAQQEVRVRCGGARRPGPAGGRGCGESSRPLLASLPLPLLTTWAHLAQASYRTGHYALAKRACSELWDYITHDPLLRPSDGCSPEGLAQTRSERQSVSAPPRLHIHTDRHPCPGAVYCDALTDGGPPIWGQRARLAECERMLVAVDLALWLNDSGAALQGVVGCYGLLAPLIYHQIPAEGVVQVLLKCLAVLLEIPGVLRQKRQAATAESLLHMVACITFYLAKGQKGKPQGVEEGEEPSVQLKALEASALKSIPAGTAHRHGNGTQGTVMKMKRKACFLELAVLVLQRALWEGQVTGSTVRLSGGEVCSDIGGVLGVCVGRRDEGLTGQKKTFRAEIGGLGGAEDGPKKYTSSVIEFNRKAKAGGAEGDRKQRKQLSLLKAQHTEREIGALDALRTLLPPLVRRRRRGGRLRQLCSEERPGRCHINLALAQSTALWTRRSSLWPTAGSWCPGAAHPRAPGTPNCPPPPQPALPPAREEVCNSSREEAGGTDCGTEGGGTDTPRTQLTNDADPSGPSCLTRPGGSSPAQLLESLYKAALHYRRALVLAHRGALWVSLQWVCGVLWDQVSSLTLLVERGHAPLSLEQINSALTPLLALATDLLLDMMHTLQMCRLFEGRCRGRMCRLFEEEGGGWMRSLSLRSLELLALQEKWETVAHLALLFNHNTRERYTHMVPPLLVHAQRRLQAPGASPHPHTHHRRQVSCRNYANTQLLMPARAPREGGRPKTCVMTETSDTGLSHAPKPGSSESRT
ncbi:hypothetical protein AAFF_G00320350 [Aldrovandia affinis]|uniref:Cilia- and flagella-associated protein 54 n=1 Tax=Aldrovandia affinis TaxID=143900 RepID=A0AAD7R7J4_9TELE|nr:hypothetical protein AAFF_G00320350 [Aldrovandia affinis]